MIINIKNLTLSYKDTEALTNVSLTLEGNKIYGLLGRNGAGKTSLLSILASFRQATSGEILINGKNPFEQDELMQQVYFLFAKDYKDDSRKVSELLKSAELYRPNFDQKYAKSLIKQFNLPLHKPMKKLSTGMQSATNVVLGLASRCPVTIFDEVYLGMDAPARDLFYKELLKEQETHPRMIILSTHLVSEMDYLFDEVIILHKGSLIQHEKIDSFLEQAVQIFGPENEVESFVQAKKIIHEETLGNSKATILFDSLSEEEYDLAEHQGLQTSQVSLNDLFIHLTKE